MQQTENTNTGTLTNLATASRAKQNKWLKAGVWGLQMLTALVFLAAGGAKLAGIDSMVEEFERIGVGQWFRYVTGAIEIGGAIALLISSLSGFGALLLAATMVGAIFTHLFVFNDSPAAPLVFFVLLMVIAWSRRDTIKRIFNYFPFRRAGI
jgi:uncharacterized membrane protein YphA (DoxX/SURF4 family)